MTFLEFVFVCLVVISVAVAVFMLIRLFCPPDLVSHGQLEPVSTDDIEGILPDAHDLIGEYSDGSPAMNLNLWRRDSAQGKEMTQFLSISSFCTS